MSKAFTKEDDGDDDGDDLTPRLPVGQKNYMTPQCEQTLRAELHQLLHEERPKLVETIAWAAGNGDRSENADYIYGKRRLREIDRRLRFLSKRLESAEVIDPTSIQSDRVRFGATVVIRFEDDREKTFSIVGIDETDASRGKISWISPLGSSLLNAQEGDVVSFRSPRGAEDVEVLKISYVAIPGAPKAHS
jgi:transcription elongation factor GreB